jgi:HPt (histidine-containing phosphotransfer) domain-containing protein
MPYAVATAGADARAAGSATTLACIDAQPDLASPSLRSLAVTAAAAATPAVLDADALARLRELDPEGRARLLERVLSAFETSAARLAKQFGEARARGDMQGIRHVAHTLKSSSASIGALTLSRVCADIEAKVRAEAFAGLTEHLDAMDRELAAVLQAVSPMLSPSGKPS